MQRHWSREDGAQSAHLVSAQALHVCAPSTRSHTTRTLLCPWIRVLLEKLTVSQLMKKFQAFCGSRRFIAVLNNNSPPLVTILDQMNPVYNTPFYCFNIHFNIKLPSNLRSSKWSLSLYPTHATCSAHLIFFDFIQLITFQQQIICTYLH